MRLGWDDARRVVRFTHNPGYVLVGPGEHVHLPNSRTDRGPHERVPRWEEDMVHQALAEGWLFRGEPSRMDPHGQVVRLHVAAKGLHRYGAPRTVTYQGGRYVIEVTENNSGPGSRTEFWAGRGYVASYRKFTGADFARTLVWAATVNPTGRPADAGHGIDGLRSRRAALDWLFNQTGK